MDRKNMALILSIFLFVGLLFSVDPLERERDYNYGETHQIYSAGAGLTSGVSCNQDSQAYPDTAHLLSVSDLGNVIWKN